MTQFASTRRSLIGLLLALAGLLLVPVAASAAPSSAVVDSDGILDVNGDNFPHTINISYSAGAYLISDSAGVTAGGGCVQTNSKLVTCTGGGGQVAVGTGSGADQITIASVSPTAGSSSSFLTATGIFSGGGKDTIGGSPLKDEIISGEGNDRIDGGLGPDLIDGKQGFDTLTYASRPASQAVFVQFQSDPDNPSSTSFHPSGSNGGAEGDSPYVENVIGTPGNDTMIGYRDDGFTLYPSFSANTFTGGAGNDRLLGVSGPDKLLGGPGRDTLIGGSGGDRCVGGSGKDHAKQCEHKKSI